MSKAYHELPDEAHTPTGSALPADFSFNDSTPPPDPDFKESGGRFVKGRDPRRHTLRTVYLGRAQGEPKGGDDAAEARAFPLDALPSPLCFDHATILADYVAYRRTGKRRSL